MQTVMRELEWLHILSPIRYEAKKKKRLQQTKGILH